MIHHLAPNGIAGFVLANGSMSSNQSGEGEIRRAMIEADLVDCMIALPGQLFYTTQIPACLWFVTRNKKGAVRAKGFTPLRDRWGETLFINARKLGYLVDRPHHCQPLYTQCPHCHQTNLPLAWRSRPGYCSRCSGWLGICLKTKSTDNVTLTQDELRWQTWVVENIGDLIAATPRLSSLPPREKIAKTLSAYVDPQISGNIAAFAHLLGMHITPVSRWYKGQAVPVVDTLLQICSYFGISLLSFLVEEAVTTNSDRIVTQYQSQPQFNRVNSHEMVCNSRKVKLVLQAALNEYPPRSLTEIAESLGYRGCNSLFYHSSDLSHAISARYSDYQKTERLKKIQQALEAVLESQECPPPSIYEVAKRLGISAPVLKRYCLELCNAISERYASFCQERKMKRLQKQCQEIREVAFKLHAEGIEPTASRISAQLSKPLIFPSLEAVAAVREVRHELGWETMR